MNRDKKRLLSKTSAMYIVTGIILITLMAVLGASAFLSVMVIEVEGASIYDAGDVIIASGISIGDNLISIRTQNVSAAIRRELPIINSAQVTRILPNTIYIKVTESAAIATIPFDGEYLVIDSTGRVLKKVYDTPDGLIKIRGVEINNAREGDYPKVELGTETKLQYMQDVLSAIEREGLESDISYLDVSNITNVHFEYLDRYRVILGGVRDLRYKLSILPDTAEEMNSRYPNTRGDINMSDPSGRYKFTPT